MYLGWCVIWLPWKLLNYFNQGLSISQAKDYFQMLIFSGAGDALWYLPALAAAAMIFCFLQKITNIKIIIIIASVLYAFSYSISTWYGVVQNSHFVNLYYRIFITSENGLLYGLLFFAIGSYIRFSKRDDNINFLFIKMILSFVAVCAEAYFVNRFSSNIHGSVVLLTIPVAIYFLFQVILNIKLTESKKYKVLRELSTIIYLSHCWIIRALKMVAAFLKLDISSIMLFFATVSLTMVFSIIMLKFIVPKYKQLRFLI